MLVDLAARRRDCEEESPRRSDIVVSPLEVGVFPSIPFLVMPGRPMAPCPPGSPSAMEPKVLMQGACVLDEIYGRACV